MTDFKKVIEELIYKTSTILPHDVTNVISRYADLEKDETPAKLTMNIIKDNIKLAADKTQPICQDTGSILFFIKGPKNLDQNAFMEEARSAVTEATAEGILRQNSVDPLTGINSGNNLGPGSPFFHFEQHESKNIDIRLILKGGGCENVGAQYALPHLELSAERDINGVRKCILDAVLQAQGKGCAPAVLGVCIGGDRPSGYLHSKEQFLRKLDDTNPDTTLAIMEDEIVEEANQLDIGPMGFGGKTTLLGCKIGFLNRVPASYFVTISYMCWAFRRQGVLINSDGNIKEWLY